MNSLLIDSESQKESTDAPKSPMGSKASRLTPLKVLKRNWLGILALYADLRRQIQGAGGQLALSKVAIDMRSFNDIQLELQSSFMHSWEDYEAAFGAQRHRLLRSLTTGDGPAEDFSQNATVAYQNDFSTGALQVIPCVPPDLSRHTTAGGGPAVNREAGADWIRNLLENVGVREAICASSFRKHATRNAAVLQDTETVLFCEEVCEKLGLPSPTLSKLLDALAKCRGSCDGLSQKEFSRFFECFLRAMAVKLDKARPCIFLDVDGVLLPFGGKAEHHEIPRQCLDALAHVLKTLMSNGSVPPRLVVTSTWRCVPEQIGILREAFQLYGQPLADVATLDDMTNIDLHIGRLEEISEWLDAHTHVQLFVVLDDDASIPADRPGSHVDIQALRQRFENRVVRPISHIGLTLDDAEQAIFMIRRQQEMIHRKRVLALYAVVVPMPAYRSQ